MPSFWKHVNRVIQEAEIILEVLDARMVDDTRNPEIEQKIKAANKKIIYAINKCDLVERDKLEQIKKNLKPSVFISSTDRLGTTILKKKILELSHGERVVVGVVGYPNVGKSSLINALSGRGSAKTSAESNYTKGWQKIRVDNKIMLLDTPGVLSYQEKDLVKYGKTGAMSYGKIKNPELAALGLIEEKNTVIKKYYQVEGTDPDEILENIAFKLKKVQKGKEADLEATARLVLKDWQSGKIRE